MTKTTSDKIGRIRALAAAQRLVRAGEHDCARAAFAALGISYDDPWRSCSSLGSGEPAFRRDPAAWLRARRAR